MFMRILCMAAILFTCNGLLASKVIFSVTKQTGTTTVIPVEKCCEGHQATLWGLAYKQGENITIQLTFYDVNGTVIQQSQTSYNNDYDSNDKREQCALEYTLKLKSGNYQLVRSGWSEQEVVSITESVILICWDCAGADTSTLKDEFQSQLDDLLKELEGTINSKSKAMQDEIDDLKKQLQDAIDQNAEDQAVLIRRIEDHERKITELITDLQYNLARLERQQADYLAQLQMLKVEYAKDVEMLNLKISTLDSKYATEVSAIKTNITRIEQELKSLESRFLSGDQALKSQIDALNSQHNALQNQVNIAEMQHRSDMSAIQSQIDAKVLLLQTEHQADVKHLEQNISNVDSKYGTEVSHINSELTRINNLITQLTKDYQAGDTSLKSQIDSLLLSQTDLRNQLGNLSTLHDRDVADLNRQITEKNVALTDKINTAAADLRLEITRLETKHREDVNDLKNMLSSVEAKLNSEVNKLEQTDRDLYDKITDLREKQADYYGRLEVLKVTHEKDMEAIHKELEALEKVHKDDVAAINANIDRINTEADKLKAQHDKDIATIRAEIDAVVNKLDDEVRKIYLELNKHKNEFAEYQKTILASIDSLQLQITMLDKAVVERLKNLENRIRYAVYSDEKLAALVEEYKKLIQEKETEIADLDLEIRDLEALGRDPTAKQELRKRKLNELLALRNELTDIEFAIKIRNDDSEFAVHEAEIEKLKAELAALRQSTDLLVKQLEEQLIATEERFLKLLAEIKQEAAAENESLRKDLDNFKVLVEALVTELRGERQTGDEALRKLIEEMDLSFSDLLQDLDESVASKLEKMKFEHDTQFENLRSTINNIAYQQRFNNGSGGGSYSLPGIRTEDVPVDNRDMRVSPGVVLDIY